MDPIIEVENLGKQFRIGARKETHATFRQSLAGAISKSLKGLQGAGSGEDIIWALKDINFKVFPGEVVGVIGHNGAGKSTLLKILSRITRPTEGRAKIYGRVGSLLEVGTGFHPELTGRENIYLNGAILGMHKAEMSRKFDEIVAFSEIEKFIDTPVKRYSSGMYVRLAFAVAAHLEPDILIVDEVLGVGDFEFQKKCLGKMHDVTQKGRTVLFVSHNMPAVKSLCGRAILLRAGRVACEGSVDKVLNNYLAAETEATATGVISDDAPRSGTGEARIRRVELFNLKDEPISRVHFGQPFRVALTLEAKKKIRDAVIGVGISSSDGLRITSSYNIDGGRPPVALSEGIYRVSVDLDVALLPRTYSLDLAVTRLSGADVDVINRVLKFEALGLAENSTDDYRWATVHGFIRLAGRWQVAEQGREMSASHS